MDLDVVSDTAQLCEFATTYVPTEIFLLAGIRFSSSNHVSVPQLLFLPRCKCVARLAPWLRPSMCVLWVHACGCSLLHFLRNLRLSNTGAKSKLDGVQVIPRNVAIGHHGDCIMATIGKPSCTAPSWCLPKSATLTSFRNGANLPILETVLVSQTFQHCHLIV